MKFKLQNQQYIPVNVIYWLFLQRNNSWFLKILSFNLPSTKNRTDKPFKTMKEFIRRWSFAWHRFNHLFHESFLQLDELVEFT